jgi:hypothetical protein
VVLAYHGVADVDLRDDAARIVVSPGHLASQVRLLQCLGFRFATAEEALDLGGGGRPPRGTVVLTFDDGLLDNLTVAAPLLERLGVRATFYLSTGLWGTRHVDVAGPRAASSTRRAPGACTRRAWSSALTRLPSRSALARRCRPRAARGDRVDHRAALSHVRVPVCAP